MGAISEIFPVGDDYVVAVVTEIDNEDYTPIEKVANNIRQTLITDKKFEKIVSEMKGSTIEEVAQNLGTEVVPFEDVRYGSFFIRNMGVEPRVIGAITATEQTNTLSEPVKGNVGAYVFVVTDIQEAETPQSIEAERYVPRRRRRDDSASSVRFPGADVECGGLARQVFLTVTGRFFRNSSGRKRGM